MIPTVPYGKKQEYECFLVCPRCGYYEEDEDGNICGNPNCESCGCTIDECVQCGYRIPFPIGWLDQSDPEGKRPDEWAVAKGHLVLKPDGEMDATWIPFALCDAAERRRWPVPQEHPGYRISERAYDAALADTSFESPMPIKQGPADPGCDFVRFARPKGPWQDKESALPVLGAPSDLAKVRLESNLENLGDLTGIAKGWRPTLEIRLSYGELPSGAREAIEKNAEPLLVEASYPGYPLDREIPCEARLTVESDGEPLALSVGQLTKYDFDETTSMVSWRFEGEAPEVLYPTKKATR